ncbi:hypothetical protein JK358_28580 [Nocardia sp. 2]|uniref:Uncharacterized protein n=1 Tax=Nocardia acididurans TaxID=2802282 RepID=A0ABS1MF70_9NOCA|nr:hypothetical protein [Nocardia acididurans]MBL1078369.1 hypothetical protein [Nocardia acididurans]
MVQDSRTRTDRDYTRHDNDTGRWDDDPLSVETTRRFARRFTTVNRILLGLGVFGFVCALLIDRRRGGAGPDPEHPSGFVAWVLYAVVLGILLATELLGPLKRPVARRIRQRCAALSAIVTLICLLGLSAVWTTVYRTSSMGEIPGTIVNSVPEADAYLSGHLADGVGTIRVPTGMSIQSIDFGDDSSNVRISGFVWQKIPHGAPIRPGVLFPEAEDAYTAADSAAPAYTEQTPGHTLYGWYFSSIFRQLFDYSSYPLDKQAVWLRMWAADFDAPAILVPDFDGYPTWRLHDMTGVDPGMVYDDWNPDFTAFSYQTNTYSATFGYQRDGVADSAAKPELYFSAGLKRDPQAPFFGQLIRWMFIAVIVFAALFLITVDTERRALVGFTTFELVGFGVGILLVIIFDQVAIRESVGARGVVYLEYFSYALYAMIALVGVNAMLLTGRTRHRWLIWGGNLLPKILYWPTYFGLVLLVTVLTFR